MTRRGLWRLLLVIACLVWATPGDGKVFQSVDQALERAFDGCKVERRTVFLTAAQVAQVEAYAQSELDSQIVHPYVARCDGEWRGTGYLDSHRVRTLPETLLVTVTRDGKLRCIDVLSFREPLDYLPPEAWYRQFEQRQLDRELALGRGIDGVTGATLTARATSQAVRRILAIDRVLRDEGVL